ncbi:VanZ family protein [Bacillus kexueae]|uniref:VanZ family protein n=1 Tax=Aeribacillus kexueae TaxID=2078952 RepID=UPI001FAFB722|nr:VanZ family protein [Bacillus kexueae]
MMEFTDIGMDKWTHFSFYGSAAFFLSLFLLLIPPFEKGLRRIATCWFGLVVISLLEEYRQLLDPNRTAEFLDGVANVIGITLGVTIPLFAHIMWRYLHQNQERKRFILVAMSLITCTVFPLLYGLHVLNEPIDQGPILSQPPEEMMVAQTMSTNRSPEEIVQKYEAKLDLLEQQAYQEVHLLVKEALSEYTNKETPLSQLIPKYMVQATALEEHIHNEFISIYDAAKSELIANHLDQSSADVLKERYDETKKKTKALLMEKGMSVLN